MEILRTRSELNGFLEKQKAHNQTVGLVPTMGALHEGHLTLIDQSRAENDSTICSIFVNPTQFNNAGDLENYPRRESEDLEKLRSRDCEVAFIPEVEVMYPPGEDPDAYVVDFGFLETVMEGQHRPGHFRGVGIVISKFFELIQPDRSYYGEKDYQQLMVIKALNERKEYGVEVVGCATVREADGLAMSSRNLRLTPEQREHAGLIHRMLTYARTHAGSTPISTVLETIQQEFAADPIMELEYFEVANADTLEQILDWDQAESWVACTAAFAGEVRLIDNMRLNEN